MAAETEQPAEDVPLQQPPVPCTPTIALHVLAFAKSVGGVNPMTNIAIMAVIATVTNIGDFCILSQF
jgi:hypothetical protein